MQFRFHRVDWELKAPLRIAYRTRTHAQTVVAEVEDSGWIGRGEALGVFYHGETIDTLLGELNEAVRGFSRGISRLDLQTLLPPGGARNALDCALWDLEAKQVSRRAWALANVQPVHPLVTAYTLSADTPEEMSRAAVVARDYSVLKLKLTGEGDLERVTRVREVRPDARLLVDANQSWNERQLFELVPRLATLGVTLIEQPLAAGKDSALSGLESAIPLCADESCQTSESLPGILGKYQYVNIKLDKTGGLTEALRLAQLAKGEGLKLMVGCMGGSSLSMAPAFIVGQLCDVVDLDGPLLAKSDVRDGIRYEGSRMLAPEATLWG